MKLRRSLPALLITLLLSTSATHAQVVTRATVAKPIIPVRLPSPGFTGRVKPVSGKVVSPPLKQVSAKPNAITDSEEWFSANGLQRPFHDVNAYPYYNNDELPTIIPFLETDAMVTAAWSNGGNIFCRFSDSILVVMDSTHKVRCAYDLGAWSMNSKYIKEDLRYIHQEIRWAVLVDSILYVSHFHRTYAESSGSQNAYITAINITTNTVLWRSAPLSCNTLTFEVWGDLIFCGYGFTKEPDFMYALGRMTGAVVQKLPVKSGPEYVIRKGDQLFVRTYDMDYVFEVTSDKLKR
jgi:hypothetical protein